MKKSYKTFLTTAALTSLLSVATPIVAQASTVTQNETMTESVSYADSSLKGVVKTRDSIVRLYKNDGSLITNRALAPHTPWVTDTLHSGNNGKTYYRVATNEYVLKSDVDYEQSEKLLGVPYISQEESGAPMGCEAASSLEALHYKGYATNMNLRQFIATMPVSPNNNPYLGFGGTPYRITPGIYQSIFPDAVTPWLNKFGHAQNLTGSSLEDLRAQINKGNPIVTWVTLRYTPAEWQHYFWGYGVNNAHVVTVDGYRPGQLHISDPELGQYWVDEGKYMDAFNHMKFAVAVY